uniref:Uncharacterized protein n=1 Tax=Coptotermes formosanus TaxID=36987 RepID=R4V0G3_COPFO|nr:hypothetical protein [Coptotermes formosanus]
MSKEAEKKAKRQPSEKNPLAMDEILKETVRKEILHSVPFTEFCPSPDMLCEATPDKPLIKTYFTSPDLEDNEDTRYLLETLRGVKQPTHPREKYEIPPTTSMEYGWEAAYPTRSIFNHNRRKTDITMKPTRWNPEANKERLQKSKPAK